MNATTSLRDAERRAVSLTYEDGIWDITWGLTTLGLGLRALTDNLWFYAIMPVGWIFFLIGKRYITLPRIGNVRLGQERRGKQFLLLLLTAALVFATLGVLWLATNRTLPQGSTVGLILAAIVPLFWIAAAYLLGFNRLYAYAVVTAAYMGATELLWDTHRLLANSAQAVAGGLFLLIGLVLLARFLRRYPAVGDEADGEVG